VTDGWLSEEQMNGRTFRVLQKPTRGVSEELAIEVPFHRSLLLGASVRLGAPPDSLDLVPNVRPTRVRAIEPERVWALLNESRAGRDLVAGAHASSASVSFDDDGLHLLRNVLGDGELETTRLAQEGTRLAGLVEQARLELPAADWETKLRKDLRDVAREYGVVAVEEDFTVAGNVLGAAFDVRLAAHTRYELVGRIALSEPLQHGLSIRTRPAAIGMLERLFGGSLTRDKAFDEAYWVEPRVDAAKRYLTPALRADLLAARDLGDVNVEGQWAEIRASQPPLDAAAVVGALLKIETGLKPRSNESPYR
jgi:hypothetical protein